MQTKAAARKQAKKKPEELLFCYDYRIDQDTYRYFGYFRDSKEAENFIAHMQRHAPHIVTINLVHCAWGLTLNNGQYFPATRSEYEKQKAAMIAPVPEQWTEC